MYAEADVAAVTRVLANRARLAMLELLMDGRAHPAGTWPERPGVALSTASGHLAELAEAGLVETEPAGRQRRYRLSRPEVARAIEALAVIAPRRRGPRSAPPRRPSGCGRGGRATTTWPGGSAW